MTKTKLEATRRLAHEDDAGRFSTLGQKCFNALWRRGRSDSLCFIAIACTIQATFTCLLIGCSKLLLRSSPLWAVANMPHVVVIRQTPSRHARSMLVDGCLTSLDSTLSSFSNSGSSIISACL